MGHEVAEVGAHATVASRSSSFGVAETDVAVCNLAAPEAVRSTT
ncbi:MAG: hypothetical protein QOF30_1071 [Acidimicrobiaceae bacterium]|jgi:hypothetical protein|nr:hypothetical protein [Acidimicrobiaceae bacterium]